MLDLANKFSQIFAPRRERTQLTERALAIVRSRFSPCAICGGNLQGHAFTKLASVIVDIDAEKDRELERLISAHDWKQASQYQEWNSELSVREYHLVLCSKYPQIALIRMLSTPEMWTDDRVEATKILDPSDFDTIMEIIGNRWVTL